MFVRTRLVLLAPAAIAAGLVALPSASTAATSSVRCFKGSQVRFGCNLQLAGKGGALRIAVPRGCDRLRNFGAESRSPRIHAVDYRAVPRSSFVLSDRRATYLSPARDAPSLRVRVSVGTRQVTLRNTSPYAVRARYSMRCR